MTEIIGDIWEWHSNKKWLVIPTNIGWTKSGVNPMGVGVAATVANLHAKLPLWYGTRCKKYGAATAVCPYKSANLILFPTKPLNAAKPWVSWQSRSCLDLIRRGAIQLQKLGEILSETGVYADEIGLPLVGGGAGGLDRSDIVSILKANLSDRFVLIER